MPVYIIERYKRKRDYEISLTAERVLNGMRNSNHFPDPPEALSELAILLPEYINALAKASNRDKVFVSLKSDKREQLHNLLDELADYVIRTCKNDKTMLLNSGFHIVKEKGPTVLGKIERIFVTCDLPGEAITRVRNVLGARAYIHEYTLDEPGPNARWTSTGSSFCVFTIKGLKSITRYYFRVIAIGPNNQLSYSPVRSAVVQ